ncbi:MAG: Rrf2 family transcriptional regulator [Gemmatimonadales bacterium]|jgi:Rrf2 family protein|nr:MAG: Rrf2 family transcriptional regulator [Gemmatimonadales bacterium]
MRVTTWTEYSLIISLHLARRGGTEPVAARDISESERLPGDYVEQILLRLRRAGLVKSVRGARGGYLLGRPADQISVHDVMAACDHQIFEINCETHPVDHERCGPGAQCSIRPVWHALRNRVDDLLMGVSLTDLLQEESRVKQLVGIAAAP